MIPLKGSFLKGPFLFVALSKLFFQKIPMPSSMDFSALANHFLEVTKDRLQYYKNLGDRTFEQLEEKDFHIAANGEVNSIAQLIQHLHGNMISRWTDFLNTDGEKETRQRDQEFIDQELDKAQLLKLWEEGWRVVFQSLDEINDQNLMRLIFIRSEEHTVLQAVQRQFSHYATHVGQIMHQAKIIKGNTFKSLSIPKGASEEFFNRIVEERNRRILVPVDFSDCSKNALQFAIDLAKVFPAKIWLIHVLYPHLNPGASIANETLNNQLEHAKRQLEDLIKSFDSPEVRLQGKIEVGFVVDQILEEERKKKIDFVILGNNGFGHGITQAFGSTASEVAFKSKSKVLLIPPKVQFSPPGLMVLANDQSQIKETQVRKALSFSQKLNSRLELVHVGKTEAPVSGSSFMQNLLKTIGHPIKSVLAQENETAILPALNEYAEEVQADWIMMIPKERSFWKSILKPPTAQSFVCCTDLPLLVFR